MHNTIYKVEDSLYKLSIEENQIKRENIVKYGTRKIYKFIYIDDVTFKRVVGVKHSTFKVILEEYKKAEIEREKVLIKSGKFSLPSKRALYESDSAK